MYVTQQQRRDFAANWVSSNAVLHAGEIGLEVDTDKAKMGDGVTPWNSLSYWSPIGPGGDVYSVFGRTGTITAQTGDYTAAQVAALAIANNLSDLSNAATARTNLGLGSISTVNSPVPIANGGTGSTTRNFAGLLVPTAVKNSSYTLSPGDYVPCDTTSGSVALTLPNAPADLTVCGAKMVLQGGTNTVTITTQGSDVFNKTGGGTTGTLTVLSQGMLLQYKASGGIWYVLSDDLPLGQLDLRYPPMPTGTASKGYVPVATGSGEVSAWGPGGGVTIGVPAPTGVTATDTPAVTTAITSLVSALSFGPATLEFQDGTYVIDSNSAVIRSVSNFAITSSGRTVIQQAPNRAALPNNTAGDLMVIADCTDFRVEGLTLDANRDVVSPITPLTATASSGQPSVTVASGQGANYQVGQRLAVFGGLGTSDSNLYDFFADGTTGSSVAISSISAGGGSGGGDLITFGSNLTHSYTQIGGSAYSDGYGPYAWGGAYLTPYQCGYQESIAGRSLSGEDSQNNLHLLNCQRFSVNRIESRNCWESPVKLGSGNATTQITDACSQGTVTDCISYHGYDQGVSVWLCNQITIKGCVSNAGGWAGVSLTASDDCTVANNIMASSYYRIPSDNNSGSGIAIEGGQRNRLTGNVIYKPWSDGIRLTTSPIGFGAYGGSASTLNAYLPAGTAAGTSVLVVSSTNYQVGGKYSIQDGPRSEALTIATIPDSTHVTFTEATVYSHASGCYLSQRIGADNIIQGNTIYEPQQGNGINVSGHVRDSISKNSIIRCPNGNGIALLFSLQSTGVYIGGEGSDIEGNIITGNIGGPGIAVDSVTGLNIRGNDVTGQSNKPGISIKGMTGGEVTGNRISDVSAAQGIFLQNGSLSATVCSKITVADNLVTRCSNEGIIVIAGDSLMIEGNQVWSCGGHAGIDLRGVTNSTIAGNVTNSNASVGIELENNSSTGCTGNQITGNTSRNDGSGVNPGSGAAWTQATGILESGNSNYNLFTLNEVDANTSAQITLVGTNSYAWNNVISGVVSGDLPIALGGTGQGTQQTAINALTLASSAKSGYSLTSNGTNASFTPGGGVTIMVAAPTGATATDTPAVTTAITNLVSALSFGPATLLFQDGTYVIDSNSAIIRSVNNFTVKSSGRTVIQQAANRSGLVDNVGGDLFIIADCTDFRVDGITFDGNRDVVAPLTALTATASSGQASVTVASGQGSRYLVGQHLNVNGGYGTADELLSDGLRVGSGGTGLQISSITLGGGSGGGDLITFTTNLTHTYTSVSGTAVSDGFGPYAMTGAYLSPYQAAPSSSVAGRTLSGEDQQCGIHLLNCQRFTIIGCTSRNVWESPFKLGSGFEPSNASLTDGCQNGIVTGCHGYHGYDQGVSMWLCQDITVTNCVMNAVGWAGVSCTASDWCTVNANVLQNCYYSPPVGYGEGTGLVTEGGVGNQFRGNIITGNYQAGIQMRASPLPWGLTGTGDPTLSAFLAAQTAAGTSIQVSSTSLLIVGGKYSILDGDRTEAITVASIVDGTHITLTGPVLFSHASGVYIYNRVSQENIVEGNTIWNVQNGNAIVCSNGVRTAFKANSIWDWNNGNGIVLDYSTVISPGGYLAGYGITIEGNTIGGGQNAAIRATGTYALNINNNRIYGSPLPTSSSNRGILLQGVTDSTVEGNRISDVQSGNGIQLTTGGPSSSPCARVAIMGNVIQRTSAEGLIVLTADSLTITGNQVSSCGGNAGIDLRGVTNSVIANNVSNANKNDGIRLEDNSGTYCQYNRITGNTCRDDGTGINVTNGTSQIQARGINETGTSNYNLITGNEVDNNSAAQIVVIGASTYSWANIISGVITAGIAPLQTISGQYLVTPTSYAPTTQQLLAIASTTVTAFTGSASTVASGSNGGEISQIATWSSPSAGVLSVANGTVFPPSGTINVAASGSTTAVVTYTGVSGNTLTGCAYVSGSATGTVATGGAVTLTSASVSTGNFTAPPSGSVVVNVSLVSQISAISAGFCFGLLGHGTSTLYGDLVTWIDGTSGIRRPYAMTFLVTGLTPGTTYNFDLAGAATSSDTLTVYSYAQATTSPSFGSGQNGSATTMTVQAV